MKALLIVSALFAIQWVQGQDMRDHWILGDSMHLQFTDSGLVYLGQVPFRSRESLCSISNENGELQLYANEGRIYDHTSQIIPGGDSMNENPAIYTSATQGAVIIPFDGKYYAINRIELGSPNGGLSYSVVEYDSILDSYNVLDSLRKIILQPQLFAEQLQIVKHGNGIDWWIIGRKLSNSNIPRSNSFVLYLLSSSGIELIHNEVIGLESSTNGELAASPDGKLLALASFSLGRLQLYDFDRCSGIISNARVIVDDSSSTYYGCAFSSNSSKLYVAKYNREVLEQVDLSSEPYMISTIFSANYGLSNTAGQLELGPNGKIYWIQDVQGSIFDSLPAMYLGVINNPNAFGLSCNYDPLGLYFGGRVNRFSPGLPNHPNYYLGPLVGSPCDTLSNMDTTTDIQDPSTVHAVPCFELRSDNTGSRITIELNPEHLNTTLDIFHSSGMHSYSQSLTNSITELNTAIWPPGVYVVRLGTIAANCPAQKFVVLH